MVPDPQFQTKPSKLILVIWLLSARVRCTRFTCTLCDGCWQRSIPCLQSSCWLCSGLKLLLAAKDKTDAGRRWAGEGTPPYKEDILDFWFLISLCHTASSPQSLLHIVGEFNLGLMLSKPQKQGLHQSTYFCSEIWRSTLKNNLQHSWDVINWFFYVLETGQ